MIGNGIVLAALVLGGFYCGLWLLKKDFRRQVEQPKYQFLRQLDAVDSRRVNGSMEHEEDDRHES